ncbi:dTDP-4-dehydrorhamnose reductase [Tenacibaculum jejuense]|uniref:dTDP-4-dehydrorhamnose reductase n=1 Tax=Tenacibaculum jejuense TaxID=584609 RepID=A0A238U8J6_9FLAO|nr:dTDP-4-dehydrorhamnose reductase [Tenacibaculum jejuense]SNR14908.1 dTDP-4-dehydrorhamnose reductase [Tenacibaculum jejuense]
MNVLVTGSSGQLGSEIKVLSKKHIYRHVFFFENTSGLDITDLSSVKDYFKQNDINAVINCAAYTAVDKAESEQELARKVNADGVRNLLEALNERGRFIHISTDYVFNGESYIPYKETDKVDPLGTYGKTKREGEEYFLNSNTKGFIIRTSWVYSSFGNNFVKTMLRLGKDRESLGVIFDQIGSPTYARDLAKVCLTFLEQDTPSKTEIYHYSNEGVASWYDFAKSIMEIANLKCNVKPIETKDYPTPAKRPNYSFLNKTKIKKDLNIEIPHWRDSLNECIKELEK